MDSRFGEIRDGLSCLNHAGEMVLDLWNGNPFQANGIGLGSMIVMPNHVHGIVSVGTDSAAAAAMPLDRFIGAFKSRSTVEYIRGVRDGRFSPFDGQLWQRSFYDRVLRTPRDLTNAEAYIEGNPARWEMKRRAMADGEELGGR
jgi:REP element-mobilizing transposase RayT